jgi:predicted SAM-dependent methyltransferase
MDKLLRVNIGCGLTPVSGWVNFDNSPSLNLSKHPLFIKILSLFGAFNEQQQQAMNFFRANDVRWADACKHIPLPDNSVEVLYSSHMLEHLDSRETIDFLKEARRVLSPDGILRIAVPDLSVLIQQYVNTGDANELVSRTHLVQARPRSLKERLLAAIFGHRGHHWMYDGRSLVRLLEMSGFREARALPGGETRIINSGELNLREREDESVYAEAIK